MKKILIIEDDREVMQLLKDILEGEGHQVIGYADKNSIKGVIINQPDLVILDNQLRDGFGYELCMEIKANEFTRNIPVILVSGYDNLKKLAETCGAEYYLSKPFELGELLQTVNTSLESWI